MTQVDQGNKETSPNIKRNDLANKSKKKVYVILGVVLLAVGLLAGVAYSFIQYDASTKSKLSKSEADTAVLEKEKAALSTQNQRYKTEVEQLNKEIAELKAGNKVTLPVLSVLESKHYNGYPNQYNNGQIIIDGKNDFIFIKAEVVNNGTQDTFFSTSDLKLKDTNDVAYPYFLQASVGGWSGPMVGSAEGILPPGYAELKSQTLKPNERVAGVLLFVAPTSLKNASMHYGEVSFSLGL